MESHRARRTRCSGCLPGRPCSLSELRDEILAHALRLARIDSYYRVGWVDPEPELVDIRDVADLRVLVAILPWKALGSAKALWLNPNFADQSTRVGGADADIIMGDLAVGPEVVTKCSPRRDLRSSLGTAPRSRSRPDDPTFPTIARIGVYYAPARTPLDRAASDFIAHPAFRSVEKRSSSRPTDCSGRGHWLQASSEAKDTLDWNDGAARSALRHGAASPRFAAT